MADKMVLELINKHRGDEIGQEHLLRVYKEIGIELNMGVFAPIYLYGALKDACEFIKINRQLQEKIKQLEKENISLRKIVLQDEEIMATYNAYLLQKSKVKVGAKIAYKEDITNERIAEAYSRLKNYDKVAKELGVSRTTIWRRINEK